MDDNKDLKLLVNSVGFSMPDCVTMSALGSNVTSTEEICVNPSVGP